MIVSGYVSSCFSDRSLLCLLCFFFNDTATTEIYTTDTLFPYTTLFRSTCALHSIEECPGIRAVEAPDDHRFQEPWIEVAQVHSVPGAGFGFQRFPVGNDAARSAAHIPQRPVAPDVAFRVLGMALDRRSEEHTSELQSLMRISYAVFCLKKK